MFAVPEDVAAIWRPLTDAESAIVQALIDAASVKLRVRVPDIDTRVAEDPLAVAVARYAVAAAVKRVLSNPEGARQRSQTDGPFTTSITVDVALSSGSLWIDDGDLAGLLPDAGMRVGSIRLHAGLA